MRLHILAAVGTLAVAGVALAAAPQAAPGRGRGGRRPGIGRIQQELGLSAEQAGQLKKMWMDERKQAIRRRADTAIARIELDEAIDAPTVDDKVVAAKQKALADLEAAALKARTDHRLALRRLLSPEQQDKMRQLMRERFHDRGDWRARGWRRQGPGRAPAMTPAPPGPGGPGGPDGDGDDGPQSDSGGR